jgi:hypothetical protein
MEAVGIRLGMYFRDTALSLLRTILKNTEKILTGLSDLQTADAALQAIVLKILTDIQTALANDDSDAAVEAASVIVNQAVTDLTNADTGLTTPPPPPAS